jgi:hypothetical protein
MWGLIAQGSKCQGMSCLENADIFFNDSVCIELKGTDAYMTKL